MKVRSGALTAAIVLVLWEVTGGLRLVADGAFPALSAIIRQWWRDRHDYPPHVAATLRSASAGFVIGVLIAVVSALIFSAIPLWSDCSGA